MLHNPRKIILIEKWADIFAWLSLSALIIYLIGIALMIGNGKTFDPISHSQITTIFGTKDYQIGFWDKAPEVIRYLFQGLAILANFVVLLGASKAVRFFRLYYAKIIGEVSEQ